MEIHTTAPGLQLYTSNFLDGSLARTKDGARYNKYAGVCLETQSFPDGPNRAQPPTRDAGAVPAADAAGGGSAAVDEGGARSQYPTGILRPGEVYRHTTIYRFSVRRGASREPSRDA